MAQSIPVSAFLEKALTLPVIDVRSPGEFVQGHIPGATNIPLFDNEERAKVGTRYKQVGKDSAVLLGLEIIGPKLADFVRQARKAAPGGEVLVHCWRGGMRSGSFAWLLETAGMKAVTLHHGYKAYRQEVLQAFESPLPLILLGGKTGSGKTAVLKELARLGEQVLDLEKLAHHKGSSFGALGQAPQPSTEQFENRLYQCWRKMDIHRPVWIEDESLMIGQINLPRGLWKQMQHAPMAFLEMPKELRIARLTHEYSLYPTEDLAAALQRIQKRLGGLHYQQALAALEQQAYAQVADITLLYYDKAYLYNVAGRDPQKVVEFPQTQDDPESTARQLIEWSHSLQEEALLARDSPESSLSL